MKRNAVKVWRWREKDPIIFPRCVSSIQFYGWQQWAHRTCDAWWTSDAEWATAHRIFAAPGKCLRKCGVLLPTPHTKSTTRRKFDAPTVANHKTVYSIRSAEK